MRSHSSPSEVRDMLEEKTGVSLQPPHVHRPNRIRDEGGDVVGAFCPCGALFNRKMSPAQSKSLRSKIVKEMKRIRDDSLEDQESSEEDV